MSMRGVATGWAGSAAVLLVAAASLGAARAQADSETDRKPAPPVVIVAPAAASAKVQPVAIHAAKPPVAQPLWLRRLLSPSDLEPGRKPS